MQKDCHFALTLVLAKCAGWPAEDAKLLAWADYAVDKYAQVNLISWIWSRKGVYFHFLPGDGPNPLITTADSKCVRALLERADTVIERAIALHAFQDSYAHPNFIGRPDWHNSRPAWEGPWPHFGHTGYSRDPDNTGVTWTDTRTGRVIVNKHRFDDCATDVYKYLGGEGWVPAVVYRGFEIRDYDERKAHWAEQAGFPGLRWSQLEKEYWPKYKQEFKAAAAAQADFVRWWLKKGSA